ncbi:penicillin-binding protein [Streptomyces bambusae]|uniref:penicillin-binding transpeptidase domain-containing protein n=1 Tax=Streptomyces bambusae TaxID=1550616 RepID=UPI001CFDAA0F|nr:penicillin-binding transpeptidase domain-containing protein [Streptomyces bambusae]MCB5167943.1 penicillin-binding protein [Streptomyces bambusae]
MRGGAKAAIVGGVFLAMAGGAGYGVYSLWDEPLGSAGAQAELASGPPDAAETRRTATEFLAAWAAGDADRAARLTNNQEAARVAVAGFRDEAHVTGAVITAGRPVGTRVPFTVRAQVSFGGKTKPLSYASELTVARGVTTRAPLVDWQPSVIHPQLRRGESLRAGSPASPPVQITDRHGKVLTAERYPSLRRVLDELRSRYAAQAGGSGGSELWIEPAAADAPRRNLLTLDPGRPGRIPTRLDAGVQAAAERAVAGRANASVVALRPSTGDVLAVANHRADGFDAALLGTTPSGSTLKIVTAAMLLDRGLVAAGRPAPCPETVSWYGKSFRNQGGFSLPASATFGTAFARSCNTAFIKQIKQVDDDAALPREAREVFGLGLEWQTGVSTFDGDVPESTGAESAAAYIGQGRVRMNPLTVASVLATAQTGVFRQPLLVPAELGGRQVAVAERRMKPAVAAQLRQMLRQTAVSGTAAAAMAGVPGPKGAKTGSAEVDGAVNPDSWFTGYSGDLAAAAFVAGGGHGAEAAGPLVAAVLRAG